MEEEKNVAPVENQQDVEGSTQEQSNQIPETANANQPEEISVRKISIEEAFNFAWNVFRRNKKFLLSLTIVYVLVLIAESMLQKAVEKDSTILFLVNIFSAVVNIFIGIGLIQIFLKVSRGQESKISELFGSMRFFWKIIGGYILYGLILLVGYLLLIIPGIIWQIKYSYFAYLIIDKDMGPIQAIKESGKITYGFKWKLFFLQIVVLLILLAGLLMLGIGFLVAYPIALLMMAYVYRTLIGEQTEIKS
ncbi:MAG: hypothetical protein ACD_5C00036G0004 [uncultured bacterium]|nr:MAG: hypothetical protein ACD_5C00036G0004 [uncultured bacterium]